MQVWGANGRTPDLTQIKSIPLPADACLTVRTTGVVEGYDGMVNHKGRADARPDLRCLLLTHAPPLQQPTPVTGYEGSIHLAEHRLRPEMTTGELAHKGLTEPAVLAQQRRG
ncbi:hypothetical protein B296_00030174 [Ensete ventricosum]|uniref:Uncharacterized protein n=1 Tax=Ensete ventricosum TaxID=4639 RepID=A0A427AJA8_ENSVE|nr:hypothetical protein B296_00030174 [Ensete ventricosum]